MSPELKYNYVNSSAMFPIGGIYARGKYIGRTRDAIVNYVGSRNNNPILDTREYCVEFDDG